jgi:hypothetical protein
MKIKLVTTTLLVVFLFISVSLKAEEGWRLVVHGEADKDTLPLDHPAYNSAKTVLVNVLHDAGFDVADNAASGLPKLCEGDACRNVSADRVVSKIREVDSLAATDAVVIFRVSARDVSATSAVKKMKLSLYTQVIDLTTNKKAAGQTRDEIIGNFQNRCDKKCVELTLAVGTKNVAAVVAGQLSNEIAAYERSYIYQLIFNGLAEQEAKDFSAAVRGLTNYVEDSYNPVKGTATDIRAQLLHKRENSSNQFVSYVGPGQMGQMIKDIVGELYIDAAFKRENVRFFDGRFVITRTSMPYKSRYIAGVTFVIALLLALWFYYVYQRRQLQAKSGAKKIDNTKQQAQQQLAAGQHYAALATIDNTLHDMDGKSGIKEELESLQGQRLEVVAGLNAIAGNVIIGLAETTVTCITDNEIILGRPSRSATVNSIIIGYDRISRPGKQARIVRQGDQLFVEDQASSNGTVLNGVFLSPHQQLPVPSGGGVLSLGGSISREQVGLCQLTIKQLESSGGTWLIEPSLSTHALMDKTGLTDTWLSLEADLSKKWLSVVQKGSVQLGLDSAGKLCLQGAAMQQAAAQLSYNNGYYIAPFGKGVTVTVDDAQLAGSVPITSSTHIVIAGQQLKITEQE